MFYCYFCNVSLHLCSDLYNKPKKMFKERHGLQDIVPLVQSVEETPEPVPTTIKGTIPTWIHGNFLRNGPGKFEFGNQQYVKIYLFFIMYSTIQQTNSTIQ